MSRRLVWIIIDGLVAINVDNYIIRALAIVDAIIVMECCPAAKRYLHYAHITLGLSTRRTVRRRQVRPVPCSESGHFAWVLREIVLLIAHYLIWINYN